MEHEEDKGGCAREGNRETDITRFDPQNKRNAGEHVIVG